MTASRAQLRRTLYLGAAASALLSFGIPAGAEDTGVADAVILPPATRPDPGLVEERQQYALRLMMQIYNGRRDFSHTQLLGVGRVRQGDRSYTQFDFGDGAVVLTGNNGELAASRFMNLSPIEKGVLYDYRTKTIYGDGEIALFHNTVVRPLLGHSPELGRNAEWTAQLPLAGLGVPGAGAATAAIELSREYFVHDDKPMVLIHYAVPAFTYANADGETIVQWGAGFSLSDPGFGMIYLNSALHRAVARTDGGAGIPYRFARTMVAANEDGSAMLDYRTVPQLARYVDEFFSKEAMQVVPTGERSLDETPIAVARNLDLASLSIAEDGANEAPIAAGAQTSTNRGTEASTPAGLQQALSDLQPFGLDGTQMVSADDYPLGSDPVFPATPTLTTAAEEAAHAVQGQGGRPDASTSRGTEASTPAEVQQALNDPQPFGVEGTQMPSADDYSPGSDPVFPATPTLSTAAEEPAYTVQSQGGRPDGGTTGSLADEVTPETMRILERDRGSNRGLQGSLNMNTDSNATFGRQDELPQLEKDKIVQAVGANLGNAIAGSDGREIGQQMGAYTDALLTKYGDLDKFIAAGGVIADLQNDLERLNQGYAALQDSVNRMGDMRSKASGLGRQIVANTNRILELEAKIGADNVPWSQMAQYRSELRALEESSKILVAEARVLDRQIGYLSQIKGQLPALQQKIASLARGIPDSRAATLVGRTSQTISQGLARLKVGPALAVLGGVNSIAGVYEVSSNLGEFDPRNPDLKLAGDYSSSGAMVKQLTLDVLGIVTTGASGNVAAMFTETANFATGRFVDLYKVTEAAEHAEMQAQQAGMEAELTRRRGVNNIEEELKQAILEGDEDRIAFLNKQLAKLATPDEVQEIYARLPTRSGVYTDDPANDGGVTDANWTDPRIDQGTGLPSADYWQYLKDHEPWKLIQLGIDPEAPVGGWPGGVGAEHRPADYGKEPQIARTDPPSDPPVFDIKDGEDYPTAPPRPTGETRPQRPTGDTTAPVLTRVQQAELEREQRRQQAQRELDEYQTKKLAERDPDKSSLPGSYEFRKSTLETSALVTSTFDIKPVTFEPVKFNMPVFDLDGDLFVRNPDGTTSLKQVGPDDFKLTPFDPPKISQFPPTDPNDEDGYPGTGEYPAFTYENMSGKEPDISKWTDWLATQDIRRLEQLAIGAGYPSLAFALADAENIIRLSLDSGFRSYANRGPNCAGTTGCTGSIGPWKRAYATIRLGDILAESREIFSTGGFSDVGISGFNLMYFLRDHGIQDGDIIDVEISQFGRVIFELRGHFLLTAGSPFNVNLRPGVAQMVITALNEGSASPNTAEVRIENVVRGEATQTYSLRTGQTAVLRIESNAKAGNGSSASQTGAATRSTNVIRSEVQQIHSLNPGVPAVRRIDPHRQVAN